MEPSSPGRSQQPPPTIDFYGILEVERTADADAIRKAYRKKALRCHPDKAGNDPAAAEQFQQLQRVYEVLSDEKKRKVYDKYGERGIAMMDTMPFIDPDMILAMNRMFLVATFFCILLLLFPIFIALKTDGKVSWSWVTVFSPTFIAIGMIFIGSLSMIFKEDEDEKEERAGQNGTTLAAGQKRSAGRSVGSMILKSINAVYFGVFGLFDILIALKLDGVVTMSWSSVFIPWWLCEVHHFGTILVTIFSKISQGVYVVKPSVVLGEEEPQMVVRSFSVSEKLWIVFEEFQVFLLRVVQIILILSKISPDNSSLTWTFVFIPFYIVGVVFFISLVKSYIVFRTSGVLDESKAEKKAALISKSIGFVLFCILIYTSIGLLINRLQSGDGTTPSTGVIMIPIFIVLGLLLCCVGCCLPFIMCLTKMGLEAELEGGEEGPEHGHGHGMRVPEDRRIAAQN